MGGAGHCNLFDRSDIIDYSVHPQQPFPFDTLRIISANDPAGQIAFFFHTYTGDLNQIKSGEVTDVFLPVSGLLCDGRSASITFPHDLTTGRLGCITSVSSIESIDPNSFFFLALRNDVPAPRLTGIPEPSSLVVLGVGLASLIALRRRKIGRA
jgi:hypothetical protein